MSDDVHYVCQRCTACCRWAGDVCLEEGEVERIARHLGMPVVEFAGKFTRLRANRAGLSLIDRRNHECIMLEGETCLIQDVKPRQCKGFPNTWNFPGWQKLCQAKAVPLGNEDKHHDHPSDKTTDPGVDEQAER